MNNKSTKELALFKQIYKERGGKSEISGVPLMPPGTPRFHCQFAHILSKGAFPNFRLLKENVVLMTEREHQIYDFEGTEGRTEYDWVNEKKEELKSRYFSQRKLL